MRKLLILFACFPILANAQYSLPHDFTPEKDGIKFEREISWKEVQQKAANEGKLIFVDCYTTWCGPCRFMADSIFTQKSVGNIMNNRFVSVKVQMDTSKRDDQHVKDWYKDANFLLKEYNVTSFPTYLFFSSDGKIIHKGVGAMDSNAFSDLLNTASDTSMQYYTLARKFEQKRLKMEELPSLANSAKDFGDEDLSLDIAKYYMKSYLEQLNDSQFMTKEHINFVAGFYKILTSKDRIFKLCYNNKERVDSVMEAKGYATSIVDVIISNEEIVPLVREAALSKHEPNWSALQVKIKKKYNAADAERNVLNARVNWYRKANDLKKYTKYFVQMVEKYKVKSLPQNNWSSVYLNNYAWNIFKYSADKNELQAALSWIEVARSYLPDPDSVVPILDTKANLLYKLGRKEEAISIEKQAVEVMNVMEEKDGKEKGTYSKDFAETLEKMKQGKDTWTTD